MTVKNKIIVWFISILVIVFSLAFFTIYSLSSSFLKENLKKSLSQTVEKNVDEIEYYFILSGEDENIYNQYIEYDGGFLEIDDDFLNTVDGITIGLYEKNGNLIYGENPLGEHLVKKGFSNAILQTITVEGEKHYVFDRKLDGIGVDGLWLRGTVPEETALSGLKSVSKIALIILCIIVEISAVIGIIIAEKILKPVKKITQAAIQIGSSKNLKQRINLGEGKDEFKTLANHFDKMVDRLDDAFEAEKRFTSDASHELRTPVAVISAQCEYALESPKETEEYIEALEVISRQSKKMSSLINDMLSLSRFEHKKGNYEFCNFDFSLCISELCEDLALVESKNITLYTDVEKNIQINGEKELLERLASNLIMNAYKYGKENGVINVSLSKKGEKIFLSVSDDGIGISEVDLPRVFDRFYCVDKSRNNAGTGLGLSMALEIARLHGGDITVESTLGKGSTFTFII